MFSHFQAGFREPGTGVPWHHMAPMVPSCPIPGVLEAMEKAQREGLGAVSLDGTLVDIASIKQADPGGPRSANWKIAMNDSINHRTISMGPGFHGLKFPEGNILNSEIGGA